MPGKSTTAASTDHNAAPVITRTVGRDATTCRISRTLFTSWTLSLFLTRLVMAPRISDY